MKNHPKKEEEVKIEKISEKSRISGYLDALVEADRPNSKFTMRTRTPDFTKVDKARGTTTGLEK